MKLFGRDQDVLDLVVREKYQDKIMGSVRDC